VDNLAKPEFSLALLHPRYWLTWTGFALWFLVSQLPYGVLRWLGKILGRLSYTFAKRRRQIATINIRRCFPELSADEQEKLVQDTMEATAFALFETGIGWFWPRWRQRKLFEYGDLQQLRDYQQQKQGTILLTLHFTTLEMAGVGFGLAFDNIAMSYRPHNNAVYDFLQSRGRASHNDSSATVSARDVKGMVRTLRDGKFVAYFPDQDYGRKHSVFAPFFGIDAATVTALPRLSKMSGAPVIPVMCMRDDSIGKYRIWVEPSWENYPVGDDVEDAARINRHVEQAIRLYPEQYLWVHRRFKTRPEGEPDFYQRHKPGSDSA